MQPKLQLMVTLFVLFIFCFSMTNSIYAEEATLTLIKTWNGTAWQDNSRIITTLNDDGRISENLHQVWVAAQWADQGKDVFEYTATSETMTMYNWTNGQWNPFTKLITTFSNGKRTESAMQMWDGGWSNFTRSLYTYNNNGTLDEEISQMWMMTDWIDQSKDTYTYDAQGRVIEELTTSVNMMTQQWENSSKEIFEYDGNGDQTVNTSQDWNGAAWENSMKSTLTYSNHIMNSFLIQDWNGTAWENATRSTMTIDNGNVSEMVSQLWLNNAWENNMKMILTYSGISSVTQKEVLLPENFALANFPNPFNPDTKIMYSIGEAGYVQLKVYDILGNEIATLAEGSHQSGQFHVNFNASGLASGVYFYRLFLDNNLVKAQRMLLMK